MNNMVKFMLKRGLVNDLARIPHCLDMSSPLMAFTVNAALKPLEALSRIVNLPPAAPVAGRPATKPKSGDEGEQQESSAQLQGNSTSDNTRAQVFNLFDFFFSIFPTLTSYSMIVLLGSGNQ
jgi:E3 ubiquitin-protein ligase HUWE1